MWGGVGIRGSTVLIIIMAFSPAIKISPRRPFTVSSLGASFRFTTFNMRDTECSTVIKWMRHRRRERLLTR